MLTDAAQHGAGRTYATVRAALDEGAPRCGRAIADERHVVRAVDDSRNAHTLRLADMY
jgi:hypothetical protein